MAVMLLAAVMLPVPVAAALAAVIFVLISVAVLAPVALSPAGPAPAQRGNVLCDALD
jgi:hypothetical protein